MKFSLSGRCVLPQKAGQGLLKQNAAFLELAHDVGFDGVDLRWEQMNPSLPDASVEEVRQLCRETGLEVASLNAKGLDKETFQPLLALAQELDCRRIRVHGDIPSIQKAADWALPSGIQLAEQMHTGGAYESATLAKKTLAEVGRDNFGVIAEPANLRMAGDDFTAENFGLIRNKIFWCHIQSLIVVPLDAAEGRSMLRNGSEVGFTRVPIRENTGCDFRAFFDALKAVGFNGYINCLEPTPAADDWGMFFMDTLAFLRDVAGRGSD